MAKVQLLIIVVITLIPKGVSTCAQFQWERLNCSNDRHENNGVEIDLPKCTCEKFQCANFEEKGNLTLENYDNETRECLKCKRPNVKCFLCNISAQILTFCKERNNCKAFLFYPMSTSTAQVSKTTISTQTTAVTIPLILKDLEKNKISVGLAVGLAVPSFLAAVGAIAVAALLWRRCHRSKSPSSEQTSGTTTSAESNERGLSISQSHQIKNIYDQVVIDNIQNTPYALLSLKSNESSAIVSHNKQSHQHNESKILSNFSKGSINFIEVHHDVKSDSNNLHGNNVSLQSDNLALCQIGNVNIAYFDETQKPDNASVYFELENINEHEGVEYIKQTDYKILLSSPKNASVFSNINKEKTEAESNIQIPSETTADNVSCQQYKADPSTYFELEKHDEIDDTESLSSDQYSKLRELSRVIDSDYNGLSHMDKSFVHEHEHTSDATVPETITSASNYSLAKIPVTTSENITSTVLLGTNEDISMKII